MLPPVRKFSFWIAQTQAVSRSLAFSLNLERLSIGSRPRTDISFLEVMEGLCGLSSRL